MWSQGCIQSLFLGHILPYWYFYVSYTSQRDQKLINSWQLRILHPLLDPQQVIVLLRQPLSNGHLKRSTWLGHLGQHQQWLFCHVICHVCPVDSHPLFGQPDLRLEPNHNTFYKTVSTMSVQMKAQHYLQFSCSRLQELQMPVMKSQTGYEMHDIE